MHPLRKQTYEGYMQRKNFSKVGVSDCKSGLKPYDNKKIDERSSFVQQGSEKFNISPNLTLNQKKKIQALSECHLKASQFEKTQGLCFLNIDQFGLFACADIKEAKEKQFSECQRISKQV